MTTRNVSDLHTPLEADAHLSAALAELEKDLREQLLEQARSNLLPYIATPVDEALRQRLQDFLSLHPELSPEDAWCKLLDLGLQHATGTER